MPDLERVQQTTPATVSQQWYESGAAADPGIVTIGITRANGTELVTPGTATSGTGTDPRTFTLTTAHTALLDRLTLTWTSSTKGTIVNYVEVVGGFLFSLAEADAMLDSNQINYTTEDLIEKRVLVEQALEDACGVAFVPRYERETVSGGRFYATDILLRWPKVRTIRAADVDGHVFSAGELDDLLPWASGIYRQAGWAAGFHNITVDYEHGHDFPPARVSGAALLLLKSWLTQGPVDDRATSMSTEQGTFALSTPGLRGVEFGIPEVDAVVERYGQHRVFA